MRWDIEVVYMADKDSEGESSYDKIDRLLKDGWEPYAVVYTGSPFHLTCHYLRKRFGGK